MSPATQRTPLIAALEQLGPHDHFCSIYENREEHYGVAIPFMQIGLDRGEKCIYIADDGTVGEVRQAIRWSGRHRRSRARRVGTNTLRCIGQSQAKRREGGGVDQSEP